MDATSQREGKRIAGQMRACRDVTRLFAECLLCSLGVKVVIQQLDSVEDGGWFIFLRQLLSGI